MTVSQSFQQRLSKEKTPTPCDYLPSFAAVIARWEKLNNELPHFKTAGIIDAGIHKLQSYQEKATTVPVYVLAMIVNPEIKLRWLGKEQACRTDGRDIVEEAKELFFRELEKKSPSISASSNPTPHNVGDNEWHDELEDDTTHQSGKDACQEGMDYLQEVAFDMEIDLLTYWQRYGKQYPQVKLVAMDVLPVQGSAVPL
ncbi:hypothetical protein PQX77_013681 [Marasmius sp. AFHP31]|nr:hypothetical protein PQX77_013681 [Marasmius sp. AFHP31]